MRKWGIGILLLTLVLIGWLFFGAGLKEYARALWTIRSLPSIQQETIRSDFLGSDDPYFYRGILAGVTTKVLPAVWVWGRGGLKYFRADEYSIYFYFSVCNDEVLNNTQQDEQRVIEPTIDTDLTVWAKKARPGQFVVVKIARPENGGNLGNLREAKAHD